MQLQIVTQTSVGRRLSTALRIESYFRALLCEHLEDEVYSQWNASRRLVTSALDDFLDTHQRVVPIRYPSARSAAR